MLGGPSLRGWTWAIAAEHMHRRVIGYVLRRWENPDELLALATRTHAYLRAAAQLPLRQDPWSYVWTLSGRAERSITRHCTCAAPTDSSHVSALLDRLEISLGKLPSAHREKLTAAMVAPASTMRLVRSSFVEVVYVAQARALLRYTSRSHLSASRDPPLLVAESAALWTLQYPTNDLAQRIEFGGWLRVSPEHVRELLLACIDDLLLIMVASRWMHAPATGRFRDMLNPHRADHCRD
jgi:hypothetical protein